MNKAVTEATASVLKGVLCKIAVCESNLTMLPDNMPGDVRYQEEEALLREYKSIHYALIDRMVLRDKTLEDILKG